MAQRIDRKQEPPNLIDADQMADWVWSSLARGADWSDHAFHLLTMATVSPDGRPAARIMTNRGAERATGRMWFYSRSDTPKISEVRGHQWVGIVGYDNHCGVQLRIAGTVLLHQHDELADQHWQHIADVSHWLFNLTEAESAAAVGNDPRLPHDHDLLAKGLTAKSRAQFAVLEVIVETIDWHQTTGSRQRRAVMHAKDQWRPTLVG